MKKEFNESTVSTEKPGKRTHICSLFAMTLVLLNIVFNDSAIYNDNATVATLVDFAKGMAVGLMGVSLIFSSRYGEKIRTFKKNLMKRA